MILASMQTALALALVGSSLMGTYDTIAFGRHAKKTLLKMFLLAYMRIHTYWMHSNIKTSPDVDEFVSLKLSATPVSPLYLFCPLNESWPTHATFIHKNHRYRHAALNNMKCEKLLFLSLVVFCFTFILPIFPLFTSFWCFDLVRKGTSLAQSPGFVRCHSGVVLVLHTHTHSIVQCTAV